MTTYSKEQIIGILKAAPEGAQYYTDGYDVKYRKVFGGKYYGYLEEAKGWVETCDKALSQERIDKGWWLVTLASLIENIPTETPEEKEVLDGIESAGEDEDEWDGEGLPPVGVECEYKDGDDWYAVKVNYLSEWFMVIEALKSQSKWIDIKGTELSFEYSRFDSLEFRKPETPKQREDRERLEAAYDLYCEWVGDRTGQHAIDFEDWKCEPDYFRKWLRIVDKTNYRKEKTHGTN